MLCAFPCSLVSLGEYRRNLSDYMSSKMSQVAPNLGALIGEPVAARLISHAGSLTNLAKCPASTVQILGAEKALFRALKSKGNTPKYGLIFHSSFIGRAGAKNKGRVSRCVLAVSEANWLCACDAAHVWDFPSLWMAHCCLVCRRPPLAAACCPVGVLVQLFGEQVLHRRAHGRVL